MRLKMYQVLILAGTVLAVLFTILRYMAQGSVQAVLTPTLEAATFALCSAGVIMGGRSVRTQFEALGSDKSAALNSPGYMRDRRTMQFSLLPAITAMAVLLAARYGLSLLAV